MKNGIDISYWQKDINYRNLNIDFCIIKSGYGQYLKQKDLMFEDHYKGLIENNIKVGIYHYSYFTSIEGARKEAENCLKIINNRKIDLPVFIDVEEARTKSLGKEAVTKGCLLFCETIKKAGYKAGVYANLDWFKNYLDPTKIIKEGNSIWLAQWNDKITADFKVNYWQYSSKGNIEGIKGNVDLDYAVDNVEKPVENPINNVKSLSEIVKEVIKGLWGNGEERKQRLTKAGYNYEEVQNLVNEYYGINKKEYYIVKKGDTLYNLAIKFKTTVWQLTRWNNLGNPNLIVVGQKLRVS